MTNILLCTDCSENAKKAIDQCLFLFKDQPASYLLLYTYRIDANNNEDLVTRNDVLKTKVNDCLNKELSRIKKLPFAQNIHISARIVFGKTENVVQRLLVSNKIELVVMGTQGENYSKNQVFGSTTKKLLYDIQSPKLIVPKAIKEFTPENQIVIIQEQQLKNTEWWASISAFSKSKNMPFKMVLLPNKNGKVSKIEIPSFIKEHVSSIFNFSEKDYTRVIEPVHKLIEEEKPSLLHLNVSDRAIASQLLKVNQQSKSVYSHIPFFIQPITS
jgi:nucleotide-binding universal stress UspA family protein